MKAKRLLILVLLLASAPIGLAQRVAILRDVKTIQVEPTVVPNPEKVREDFAPNLVADALRNALRDTNFEVADSPVRAHIVLEEFNSGNLAKRFAIGFGAARYASSATRLDGTTAERQRATTVSLRVDLGLAVRVRERLGLRVGVFFVGGEEPEWFQRLGVLPASGRLSDRVGGYGVLYIRR